MEITKYERIIFQERQIEGCKQELERWLEYATGKRDVLAENAHILSDCEDVIATLKGELPSLTEEPLSWRGWIYDIYCENDFCSRDDFVANHEAILRKNACDNFTKTVNWYSPENAKIQYEKTHSDMREEQSKLSEMIRVLQPSEKNELNRVRKSPKERINSSPSFISAYDGELLMQGLAQGLAKALTTIRKEAGERGWVERN